MDELSQASAEELKSIEEIGPTIAASVVRFFSEPENRKVIEKVRKAGLRFSVEEEAKAAVARVFEGKTVVLTGALSRYTRDEAGEIVRRLGGNVTSSVSNKTDFVIVGESPGSKYEKALKLSVTTLSEEEFMEKIAESGKGT